MKTIKQIIILLSAFAISFAITLAGMHLLCPKCIILWLAPIVGT